jgi:hypothetical protein
MRIPGGLLCMWGVVPSFRFCISVAASQKTRFLHSKNGKKHFLLDETKISLRGVPLHPNGHACVRYGLVLTNYAMIQAESSLFDLKVTQPRTW